MQEPAARERPSQHMDALKYAQRVRLARSQVKREVRSGDLSVQQAMTKDCVQTMPIGQLLETQQGWGQRRSLRVLRALMIPELKPVRTLTERQRQALVAAITPPPGANGTRF